jgi:arylsulfatase A-like enzyme
VILVTIDTLRADRLTPESAPRLAPALDELARGGTRFTRAFSCASTTAPAHAAMLTGRWPSRHSVGNTNGIFRFDPAEPTIASILRERRIACEAVVSNPVLAKELGLDSGFTRYDDEFGDAELVRKVPERRADHAVARALERLDAISGRPFFLWLHLQDTHGPYAPPAPWDVRYPPSDDPRFAGELLLGSNDSGRGGLPRYQVFGRSRRAGEYVARYDGELSWLDSRFDALRRRLRDDPRFAATLLVVTADHGEAMGEDDYWFAHGQSVGRDQVHVPLFLAGRGVPAGRTVDEPVSTRSVFATVLDSLGVPGHGAESLLPVATGAAKSAGTVFFESVTQVGLVEAGAFLRRDRKPDRNGVRHDEPRFEEASAWGPLGEELSPLSGGEPVDDATGARLRAHLDELEAEAAEADSLAQPQRRRRPANEETAKKLRSLGYLR